MNFVCSGYLSGDLFLAIGLRHSSTVVDGQALVADPLELEVSRVTSVDIHQATTAQRYQHGFDSSIYLLTLLTTQNTCLLHTFKTTEGDSVKGKVKTMPRICCSKRQL